MRPTRSARVAVIALLALAGLAPSSPRCEETEPELSRRARQACEAGRTAKLRVEREVHFQRGQALAERAVALDEHSAEAHFALFCNLGELLRLDGEYITSMFGLRRMMQELNRTLELNPEHADALASKGTLLLRLPRLLGGDPNQGEAMLRRVLVLDPNAFSTRLTLAKTCDARGQHKEARAFAVKALQVAREQGRADKIAEAQALLDELGAER
jgi:tetratricopeptide (TPR) repeat protein